MSRLGTSFFITGQGSTPENKAKSPNNYTKSTPKVSSSVESLRDFPYFREFSMLEGGPGPVEEK